MSWLVYGLALSALLTMAAWGAERVLLSLRLPSRWVWAGAMAATCVMGPLAWSGALTPDAVFSDYAGAGPTTMSSLEEAFPGVSDPEPSPSIGSALLAALNPAGVPAAFLNRGLTRIGDALEARWAGVGIGIGLWLAGSLLLLAALSVGWLRLGRSRRSWPRASLLGHAVRISSGLGPAVVGIRKPEIVLPNSTLRLAESKLRMVLLHEREHVSAGDTRLLAGGLILLVLFPWNPFLWLQHARLREAVEVDCDARVLHSGVPARTYAGTLIDIGGDRFPGLSPSPALGRPGRILERRIRSMKPRTRIQRIPAGIAGAGLALTFLILACEVETPTVEHQSAVEAGEASFQPDDRSEPLSRPAASPLIMVDGVIHTAETIEEIDIASDQIARVEVMKGEAATERFGDRAGGGVIMLTTVEAPEPPSAPREVGPANVGGLTVVELPPPPEIDAPPAPEASEEQDSAPLMILDGITQAGEHEGIDSRTKARLDAVLSRGEPLVIVDGIVQTRGPGALEALDPDDILEIEVVRGAVGAETYGSRASGGIINVTTRRN